ncbi:MAG: amidohydrolase [Carboxylicivirga sp.]|nr:amidohydrolase [Carboxylicivirga sp.]
MMKILYVTLSCFLATSIAFAKKKQGDTKEHISKSLVQQVESSIDADNERLIRIFKGIHQDPELGFMEEKTAEIVAKELNNLGYEVITGVGETGVVGILKNGDGPVVMYRADMDAIAAEEKTGLPYASKKRVTNKEGLEVPVAHLCGHDAHTTWMLGTAKVMAELKDHWSGTLVLIAQPAEELIEGASAMVDDGLYTKHNVPEPDYLLGMHTMPIPTGSVVCKSGALMAGTEQLDVTFYGKSAHGSTPQFSKDAGLMAVYAVTQYQAIVSRVTDPRDPAVITVGAINAGNENNTIPGEAVLKLNFRFFSEEVREILFKGVKSVSEGIARTYGMPENQLPTIIRKGYSAPLSNDESFTDRIADNLKATGLIESDAIVREFRPGTGSEDAHMLAHGVEKTKMAYLLVGTAKPEVYAKAKAEGKEIPFAHHQGEYEVDLKAIAKGTKIASMIVLDMLKK